MFESLRESWEQLKEGEPGERFEKHYERRQEDKRSAMSKVFFIGAGVLTLAAGVFFLAAPGPGGLVLFIGGALIAQESRRAARILDWIEVRVRRVARWALGIWRGASTPVRAGIVALAVVVAAGAGIGAYLVLFR